VDLVRCYALVEAFFTEKQLPFALCGGLAMAGYGYPTPTFDLDIVTLAEAREAFVGYLESHGFATLHRSEAFSNHLHRELGRVDAVYVRGRTAQALFTRTRRLPGPGGVLAPVLAPEHLAAMKLASAREDPSRLPGETLALVFLLRLAGVDREAMKQAFQRYGFGELWDELQRS
jgi:hypothetical protein